MRKLFVKFVAILVSLFALETLIMRLMDVYGLEGTPIGAFVDAFTLTLAMGPLIYLMFVRQLNMELTQTVPTDSTMPSPTFTRLFAFTLFINLFVISLSGLWLYRDRVRDIKNAEELTLNLSGVLEEYIGGIIGKVDVTLLTVADEIQRQAANGGIDEITINAFLAKHQAFLPEEVMSLRALSADGTLKYGTGVKRAPQINNADRIYFIRQRENPSAGLVIAPPLFTRVDKKWAIPISRRFNLPDGSFGGVVFVNLSVEGLAGILSGINAGKGGAVTLMDGELKIIARDPEPDGIGSAIGKSALPPPLQKLVKARTQGTYTTKSLMDNIERTYSYHKILGRPFYITVGLATEDYLAPWWNELSKMLASVALFLLITISSSWFIARLWKRQMALLVRLEKLNRARMTISDCNQALIRAEDEKQLLDNLCRVITETGGYRMAWVGFAEHDEAKTVKPVAFSGYDEGYVEKLDATWADTELGQNPIGKAIRSGQPVIVRKIALDAHFQSGGGGNGGDETRLRLFSVASVGRG
jgi:hypothetical protein